MVHAHQDPGEELVTPTIAWARPACDRIRVSCGVSGSLRRDPGSGSSSPGGPECGLSPPGGDRISPTAETLGGQHTDWRTIMPKKFSHLQKFSAPQHIPKLGSRKGTENPQGI